MKFLFSIALIAFWIQPAMSYPTNGGCSVQLQCKNGNAQCTALDSNSTCGAVASSSEIRFCMADDDPYKSTRFICCDQQGNAVHTLNEEKAHLKCGIQ
jgi:hypothetical protein